MQIAEGIKAMLVTKVVLVTKTMETIVHKIMFIKLRRVIID